MDEFSRFIMAHFIKALKNKQNNEIIHYFPNNKGLFEPIGYQLITVEIKEVKSPLCISCKFYDQCNSKLKGKDLDCSSYE